jgi:DNA-binding GntR family transcriptional regulator
VSFGAPKGLGLEVADRLETISRTSVAESAYRAIRGSLLAARFRPGERLVESQLATALGVSRGPIREALRRLRHEGLVVELPHRGSYAREFTIDDVVDIYNVRVGLESVAIRLAVRSRQPTAGLRQLIEAMRSAGSEGDVARVSERELEFHELLCELSENARIANLFDSIAAQVQMAVAMDNALYGNLVDIADEHEPVVEAMETGDEEFAVQSLSNHIVSTLGPVFDRLGSGERAARARARLIVSSPQAST